MQHEIVKPGALLNPDGSMREPGFARSLLQTYDRSAIKAGSSRIKEWDYYLIYDDEIAVALTFDDNSYMGMVSASYIDFTIPSEKTTSPILPFTFGKLNLPPSSERGRITYSDKRCKVDFEVGDDRRHLVLHMDDFEDGKPFDADLILSDEPQESMVIATPFANKKTAFYYNQKIVGMRASGSVSCSRGTHEFDPTKSFGILDWGRGVWTYENTWYWGAGQGEVNGKVVGFNIGYGFGDTSAASENVIFYDGKVHKLDQVTFNIPGDTGPAGDMSACDFMAPWTFTSNDGRFEMDFVPILDRCSKTAVAVILSDQHQVFGRFSGTMVLDDGTRVELEDFIGFAERVHNKW